MAEETRKTGNWIKRHKALAALIGGGGLLVLMSAKGHGTSSTTGTDTGTGQSTGPIVVPVAAGTGDALTGTGDGSGVNDGTPSNNTTGDPGPSGPPGDPGPAGEPGPPGQDASTGDTIATPTAGGTAAATTSGNRSPGGSSAKTGKGGKSGHGGSSGHAPVGNVVHVNGHAFAGASAAHRTGRDGKYFTQYNVHYAGKVEKVNIFHAGPNVGKVHVISTTPSHQHANHAKHK